MHVQFYNMIDISWESKEMRPKEFRTPPTTKQNTQNLLMLCFKNHLQGMHLHYKSGSPQQ